MASDTLRGIIERITYHNEENGYTVAQLTPDGASYTVPVIGNMLGLNVGESVLLTGAWVAHAQYGRQFKADQVRTVLPATIAGLEKYLGSGLIKGIGPVTAKRIVRKFGLDTLRVIEEEPARLHEVLGVGRQARRADHARLGRAAADQRGDAFPAEPQRLHRAGGQDLQAYGDDAIEIVKTDPYRLAREVYGIGFVTADKIARELGIAADAPERVAAGRGLCARPGRGRRERLSARDRAGRSAPLNCLASARPWPWMGSPRCARASRCGWRIGRSAGRRRSLAEERPVYLIPFYYGEIGVTNRLRRLIDAPGDRLAAFQAFNWPAAFAALAHQPASDTRRVCALTPQQMQAVQAALTCRVTVLTGGPGTGQDDLHPQHHPPGRGRGHAGRAGLPHRSRGQAAERNDRTSGENDPPSAGVQAGRGVRVPAQRGEPAGSRPGDRGRSLDARPAAHEPPAEGDPGRRAPPARGRRGSVAQRRARATCCTT